MKTRDIAAFTRIFSYVWPQWPRLIVIVCTAIIIAILFSLSFATIIPLLKVMMGEEGLHGWVDREVCNWRYGIDFYVPEMSDVMGSEGQDIGFYLRVTDVDLEELGETAGIKTDDRIVGAGSYLVNDQKPLVNSSRLLQELATAPYDDTIKIQVRRLNIEANTSETVILQMPTGSRTDSFKNGLMGWGIDQIQWAVSFTPREESAKTKQKAVILIIVAMSVVTTLRCIARFYQAYLAEKVVQISIANLREDAFAHVMNMPVGFFGSKGTSDTTSRVLGDTATVGKGVKILLGKTLREPLKALGTLVIATAINWKLTLIFLGCAPATIALFGLLGKKIKKATRRSLMSAALMLGKMQDAMKALRVIKVYNQQEHENAAYRTINLTFLRRALRVAKVEAATNPLMEILGMFAGSAALLVGVHWVCNKNMDASMFFGLLVLLGSSAESLRKVSDVWNKVQGANAAAERVYAIMDHPEETEKPNAAQLPVVKDKIEFKDIVFTYPEAEKPVLTNLNLTIPAGQTIAVVGPNGSGKTTLVNLIPRFYDPDSGCICFDGNNIQDCTLKSLRDQIGMVTQNVVTFNDTIAANIGYGKPNATREQIIQAAKRSFAHEFIEPLPNGYDTMIGEHGSGFSGGQLQRMVIARAILKNPAVLIFDEAMSQVDADSEAKIHKALEELMTGRTCFVIAHRFSTVISADKIVVMDAGQIVAQGTHEQLTQSCPLYKNLYETQLIST